MKVRLGDVIKVHHGFAFSGEGFGSDPALPQVLTPGNFGPGERFRENVKSFEGDYPAGFQLASGDLVVSMTDLSKNGATLGLSAVVPKGKCYLHNQRIGRIEILDSSVLSQDFLHYYFHDAPYRRYILATATGSTVRHTSPGRIEGHVATLPPLAKQVAVAEVLGALDDKIAVNRKVLKSSDDMIRTSYDTLSISTSATLGSCAYSVREQVGADRIPAQEKYVGLEHFERQHLWLERFGKGRDITSAKNSFRAGDTLFGKLRPYFHKVSIAPAAGICSTDVLVIRAVDKECQWLVAAAASSNQAVALAVQNSNGTRMPRAKWEDIAGLAVPDPASAEARGFERLATSLGDRCFAAVEENESLARTRDELLPLLMSGKITVKDAEKRVEGVV